MISTSCMKYWVPVASTSAPSQELLCMLLQVSLCLKSVDLCSAQEGNETWKSFFEGYGILMWRYPTLPRQHSYCWAGRGFSCAKERGIQSVKDTDKDFEVYQENGLFIWGCRE